MKIDGKLIWKLFLINISLPVSQATLLKVKLLVYEDCYSRNTKRNAKTKDIYMCKESMFRPSCISLHVLSYQTRVSLQVIVKRS